MSLIEPMTKHDTEADAAPERVSPRIEVREGNPWGLDRKHCLVLEAYCLTGSIKGAAHLLGCGTTHISNRIHEARLVMGKAGVGALVYLSWDRWHLGEKA